MTTLPLFENLSRDGLEAMHAAVLLYREALAGFLAEEGELPPLRQAPRELRKLWQDRIVFLDKARVELADAIAEKDIDAAFESPAVNQALRSATTAPPSKRRRVKA